MRTIIWSFLLSALLLLVESLYLGIPGPVWMTSLLLVPALAAWSVPAVVFWVRCAKLRTEAEPGEEPLARLIGLPKLDPLRGIVADASYKGEIIKVLVQPVWWPYLTSSTLSPEEGKEAAVMASSFSTVKPDASPKSLVKLLTADGAELGMGSRVKYRGGDYLLTAFHCWDLMQEGFCMSRNGNMLKVEGSSLWKGSPSLKLDFALIQVPAHYWAKLSVGSSPLKPLPSTRSYVSVFGGPSSTSLLSTMGAAWRSEDVVCLEHGCSTAAGWSGSPLYSADTVVGVHTRQLVYGTKNAATDVAAFLDALQLETVYSESGLRQIEMDEALTRDHPFFDFELESVEGFVKGKMAKGELALYKPEKEWFDAEEGEDLPDVMTDPFYASYRRSIGLEAAGDLNSQRATVASVPPLPNLAVLSGTSPNRSEAGFSLGLLEDRFVSLERGLSALSAQMSLLLSPPSPNSPVLVGQIEVPLPSGNLSSSKLESSEVSLRPQTLKTPSNACSPSTPEAELSSVSGSESSSTKKSSGSKSKRRRSRRKSTGKQAQVPPGPGSEQPTAKSSTATQTSSAKRS